MYPGPLNLPPDRVRLGRPIKVMGVDNTGTLMITGEDDLPKKVYIYI